MAPLVTPIGKHRAPAAFAGIAMPLAAWAAMSSLFYLQLTRDRASLDRFLTADMASAYNLALDVAADPSAVLDWTLPNANYLFPELFLLYPFAVAGWPFDAVIPFYGAISLLVLTLGSYLLARRCLAGWAAAAAASLTVTLAGSLLLVGPYPGNLIAAPNFHSGMAVFTPLILAAAIRGVSRRLGEGGSRGWAAFATLLAGLLAFSDRLAAVSIAAPLAASLLAHAVASPRHRRACLWLAASLALAAAAGVLADMLWRPDNPGVVVAPRLAEFWPNMFEMFRLAHDLRVSLPWIFYGTIAAPVLALAGLAAEMIARRLALLQDTPWLLLAVYVLVYFPLMAVVHAGSTLEPVLHYRLTDLVMACVFLPILFLRLAALAGMRKPGLMLVAAAIVLSATHTVIMPSQRNFGTPLILPLAECLDDLARRYGVSYGAAEYWDAIPMRPLSRQGLTLISAGRDFKPRNWNQTRRLDLDRPYEMIVDRNYFDPVALAALPAPRAIETCSGRTVYILKPQ